jgi:hypothetical protein
MSKNEEIKNTGMERLLKKVNTLLNEVTTLKSERRELEKINTELLSFLKGIPAKDPIYKQSNQLYIEIKARL